MIYNSLNKYLRIRCEMSIQTLIYCKTKTTVTIWTSLNSKCGDTYVSTANHHAAASPSNRNRAIEGKAKEHIQKWDF